MNLNPNNNDAVPLNIQKSAARQSRGGHGKALTKYRMQSPPLTTSNFLSHSVSPTTNQNKSGFNNQNYIESRKRSYHARRGNNLNARDAGSAGGTATGSLL